MKYKQIFEFLSQSRLSTFSNLSSKETTFGRSRMGNSYEKNKKIANAEIDKILARTAPDNKLKKSIKDILKSFFKNFKKGI